MGKAGWGIGGEGGGVNMSSATSLQGNGHEQQNSLVILKYFFQHALLFLLGQETWHIQLASSTVSYPSSKWLENMWW